VVEVWKYEWRDKEVVGSTPTHNNKLTLTPILNHSMPNKNTLILNHSMPNIRKPSF